MNIYVLTTNKPDARKHLDQTVLKPPYAWGLVPGKSNGPRWERLSRGDVVIFKYDGAYRVSVKVISKRKDRDMAITLWGSKANQWSEASTWELMIFFSPPTLIEVPESGLECVLGARHVGLQRLTDDRIKSAHRHFGSEDDFKKAFSI